MRKLFSYILLLGLCAQGVTAQQDAMYSQYMFNTFAINPAYAGSRQSTSIVVLAREQWMGMDGAPSSQSVSMHTPFHGKNFAVGINVVNDKVGPMHNLAAFGTYAYHLRMARGKLALGLRAGVYQSTFNQSLLDYKDETDVLRYTGNAQAYVPSFDFGSYYYGESLFLGIAATHLTQQAPDFDNNFYGTDMALKRHFLVHAGYALKVSDNLFFKPSTLVKYSQGAPLNIDLNASFLAYNTVWLGASYRHQNAIVLLTEINVTDFLRIGYSYDIVMNRLQHFNKGTHEFFLGYDLQLTKSKSTPTKLL